MISVVWKSIVKASTSTVFTSCTLSGHYYRVYLLVWSQYRPLYILRVCDTPLHRVGHLGGCVTLTRYDSVANLACCSQAYNKRLPQSTHVCKYLFNIGKIKRNKRNYIYTSALKTCSEVPAAVPAFNMHTCIQLDTQFDGTWATSSRTSAVDKSVRLAGLPSLVCGMWSLWTLSPVNKQTKAHEDSKSRCQW